MTDAEMQEHIDFALDIHDASERATLYLAAHLAAVSLQGDTPGETTSETIGPRSYDVVAQARSGDDAFYTRTEYGRRYLVLSKRVTTGLYKVMVV